MRERGISAQGIKVPERAKRVATAATVGAVIGGGEEYVRQRGEIVRDVPLEEGPLSRVRREVVVFKRVDKGEVGRAALRGAVAHGGAELLRREPRVLPIAA